MTATNHALSGAIIGLTITQPAIALPLAFASHFVLDAIPHLGVDEFGGHLKAKRKFRKILFIDAGLLSLVTVWLLVAGAPLLAFMCLILAGSPDLIWAYRYIFQEEWGDKPPRKMNGFNRFHSKIQPAATLRGAWVEVPLASLFILIVSVQL